MYYKFIGGSEDALLEIFTKAVANGSVKFTPAHSFNDPFEFKFANVAPTRATFDRWHSIHAPHRTKDELENAWRSLSGPAKSYTAAFEPRLQLMKNIYVLCLAGRWDSHLMWAHYAAEHRGFVICYRPELITTLAEMPDHAGDGNVTYSDKVPEMRWFSGDQDAMATAILTTKSSEWTYEQEYRVLKQGPAGSSAIIRAVDPNLIAGVILGDRAPDKLAEKALGLQKTRKDFTVERIGSMSNSYKMIMRRVEPNVRIFSGSL
ncbi:DUF2971 domain-containing protein [Kordiimonas aestuarii]|uniref:DUF2971 domain-containing protein n=1 Tax=Kordiimonas aestuarii TaxID=1005925 RepID=UPI0021D25CE4|nr:DUF2971 domain-containing protein [Kordiimonas aestuarii]